MYHADDKTSFWSCPFQTWFGSCSFWATLKTHFWIRAKNCTIFCFSDFFFFLTKHKLYVWNPLSCWTSSFFTVPLRIIFPFPVTTLDCTLGGSFKSVMSLMFFFCHARNIPRVTLMLSQAVQMCIHGRLLLSCCNTLPLCLLACQMWISSS